MRLQIRNVMAALVVAMMALAVGCASDDADFSTPDSDSGDSMTPDVDAESGVGYLAIGDLLLYVDVESEDYNNDDYMVDDDTKATTTVKADGSYLIIIYKETTDSTGATISTEVYRTTYAGASADVELAVGNYSLEARSCDVNDIDLVGEDPEYASKMYSFVIGANQTTTVSDVVTCYLANVKTSLEMSVDLLANFDIEDANTPLTVTISFGDASYTYSYDDIINGELVIYYAVPTDTNTMTLTLNGMYNIAAADETPNYVEVSWVQTITNVYAGQYRVITINYANYNDGKIHIEFTITTWVYGVTIGVDVMSSTFYTKGEDEIIDPDDFVSDPGAPVVTLGGDLDISEAYNISPDMFDDGAASYSPEYSLVITPESGATVKSVALNIFSIANANFSAALNEAGFDTKIDLWSATDGLAEGLGDYVYVSGSDVLTFDMLYAAARAFGDYYGAYNMKLTVVDSEGRESNTLLMLNSTTLSMVWNGYDFATRYEIWTEDEYTNEEMISVELDVTSVTGITAMKIKMVSAILTDDVLSVMDLATEMDLVNPATSAMESSLKELGFPTGDDIKGKTAMVLDISEFMPLLAMLSESGSGDETDFVITVEDASGSLSKTLMLKRR